jgi:hypothetical protein
MRFIDITGQVFTQWTVLSWAGSKGTAGQLWLCRCTCGTERIVIGSSLKKGLSKSCGCTSKNWCRTHMMGKTPEYYAWAAMLQRCYNPNNSFYKRYGARGITVCERWKNSFADFYSDMGAKPANTSIDRIDNNGNYEPSNCRWATQKAQLANREITKKLEVDGRRTALSELAESAGLSRKSVNARINAGWSVEDALNKPMRENMTHCRKGHEYTPENLRFDKVGAKVCKECSRLKTARYRERKKQQKD